MSKPGTDGVSVGGTGVRVGVGVGVEVAVGSGVDVGVDVKVGALVAVGTGVSVGFGAKALQDVNVILKTKSITALKTAVMVSLVYGVEI